MFKNLVVYLILLVLSFGIAITRSANVKRKGKLSWYNRFMGFIIGIFPLITFYGVAKELYILAYRFEMSSFIR